MNVYLSANIKNYRTKHNLTQAEFAKAFNISPQAVSKWELGTGFPDLLLIIEIANAFKVTIDELLLQEITYK